MPQTAAPGGILDTSIGLIYVRTRGRAINRPRRVVCALPLSGPRSRLHSLWRFLRLQRRDAPPPVPSAAPAPVAKTRTARLVVSASRRRLPASQARPSPTPATRSPAISRSRARQTARGPARSRRRVTWSDTTTASLPSASALTVPAVECAGSRDDRDGFVDERGGFVVYAICQQTE